MSEFVFLYRIPQGEPPSPREMQERMAAWMRWMKDLDEKGHIAGMGHPLANAGAVVKKGSHRDGPYAETKDIVMGFTVIAAKDLEEAMQLAGTCPIVVGGGGLVEVRPVAGM